MLPPIICVVLPALSGIKKEFEMEYLSRLAACLLSFYAVTPAFSKKGNNTMRSSQ